MTNEQNKIIEVSYLDILNLLIFLKKKKAHSCEFEYS